MSKPLRRRVFRLSQLAAGVALLVAGMPASAFTLSSGREVRCEVWWAGQRLSVAEEYIGNGDVGERHPELGGSAAVVRRRPDGSPVIVFDRYILRGFRDRLPLAADFVFFHECAHIRRQTRDEIEANCHALLEARASGLVDAAAEKELETFHQRLGRLPLRYGGNGARFWASTLACVDDPEAHAEDPQAFPGGMFDPPFAP